MESKKSKVEMLAITRDVQKLNAPTDNIYESVNIIVKRANQISAEVKEELNNKFLSLLYPVIIWKKYLKTENKLKLPNIMSIYQRQL